MDNHLWRCLLVGAFIVCRVTADVSLDLSFVGNAATPIYIGEARTLKVNASFDPNKVYTGVRIELLPSTSQLVFALSDVISATRTGCTSISNLHSKDDIKPHLFSDASYDPTQDIVAYKSRAELDLGNVTTGSESCTYIIEYEIVHVSLGNYTADSQYWTSVGMEYTDTGSNYIWVSQVDSTLKGVNSGINPVISVAYHATPASEIELSTVYTTTLQLSVAYPRPTIEIVTSLTNGTKDGLYITGLKVTAVGSAYAYALQQDKAVNYSSDCPLSTNRTLSIGTIINKESQKATRDANASEIALELSLQADSRAVLGSNYSVQTIFTFGGSVSSNTKEFFVKVVQNKNPRPFTTFQLINNTGRSVPKGNVGFLWVELEVPSKSSHLYNLILTTSPVNSVQKAFSILSVSPVMKHENIQCSFDDVTEFLPKEDAGNTALISLATFNINVTNMNFDNSSSNLLKLSVAVMALNDSSVIVDDSHTISVNVNGLLTQSVTYTVATAIPYATNLAYNYNVKPVCGNDPVFHPGSVAYFDLEITTERNKTTGPMTIEAPIPDNLTQPVLTFVNAKIVKKGKNLLCTALGKVPTNLSDWISGSNESDRAVLNLPLVCNIEVEASVDEDKFTLRIGVRIKDLPDVLDGNMTQVNFSLGLKISDQIWVYTTTANVTNKMKTPASPAFVKGIDLLTSIIPATWPTGFDLEWSPDKRKFYPSKNTWLQQSTSEWNLDVGLIGYWFRLVSKDGGCMPADYSLTSVLPKDNGYHSYGPTEKQDNLFRKLQLAVDDDDSTCLSLPAANSTDTVPYLWLTLEPKFIGLPNQTSPFNLTLVGNGFGCYGRDGDQVTKVSHPTSGNTNIYEGRRPLCKIIPEQQVGSQYRCVYKCDCKDLSSCNDVNIFMRHSLAQSFNDYNLCTIKANKIS
ncbi:uncharacterized protein LOC127873470 [Dreissena polymorpha]|uniref:Uncharacterized protein n=1 Tax=Dreissena polymorpha TaxID=45954 RepID=A0A9D4KVQ6_DREPO|nr:uncharacterized protein LOC127873470 [Dreissena polymorpha]KAH3846995.1 hypothetical protein DPMN_089306 [Dreissena polymorpha]